MNSIYWHKIFHRPIRNLVILCLVSLVVSSFAGCVYYNTFYNARKAFNQAEAARKKSKIKSARGNTGQYSKAIEKSLKVIENYPNSKWYDDALHVLAVSYFYTGQYSKAERRFREILSNYPESPFVREANLYLAKSKLMQDDMSDAMGLFETIFRHDYDKEIKAEAAMTLGTYHYDDRNYREAEPYFLAVRDSLGTEEDVVIAQQYIADAYYNMFRFSDALGAYLQLLGLDPGKDEKYHALFQSAICSYRLQRIDDGMDYLQTLIDDEIYFDSLGVLKLKLAEGFEYDEDLPLAEVTYEEVATEATNKRVSAQAYFSLGLIYQYDYDDLVKAKEYYDEAVRQSRTSDAGREALLKSSDIGKLNVYARTLNIDSTTTQEEIDNAAHTQYLLSELYWFKLNKSDTAMLEMQYLIDSFPSAFEVPKAMVALSQMYREHKNDTVAADSIIQQVLTDHAQSDFVIEALDILGLKGTEADTGYAFVYLSQAEEFLDSLQIDSARANYQYIVDNLPDSRYYLQARFALIWLTEMYQSPGDSSVIFAYNEFIDSFPNTDWAGEARRRTSYTPRPTYREEEADTTSTLTEEETDPFAMDDRGEKESDSYVDPMLGIYVTPEGDSIINLPTGVEPVVTDIEFEFPVEATRLEGYSWEFYFQILFDFSGEVIDYKLVNPSPVTILNQKLEETVSSMTFDITNIPLDIRERWFVYKYVVIKPEHLR